MAMEIRKVRGKEKDERCMEPPAPRRWLDCLGRVLGCLPALQNCPGHHTSDGSC